MRDEPKKRIDVFASAVNRTPVFVRQESQVLLGYLRGPSISIGNDFDSPEPERECC
jgi:hypothetical protein